MNTVKKETVHGFSQFKLTQKLLNNLSQFKITPTAKLVLLYLSSCYNPKKADMFPKQKTIATKTGISERSVIRAVQELIKAGLLIVECKHTNRYKFTSQIVSKPPTDDFYFCSENLSDNSGQNDTPKSDNLSSHNIEPKKEQKIEPVEDFKILKQYALSRNVKNVRAYIEALKRNGSDKKIIADAKAKQEADLVAQRSIDKTKKLIAEYRDFKADPPRECEAINEFLRKYKGI